MFILMSLWHPKWYLDLFVSRKGFSGPFLFFYKSVWWRIIWHHSQLYKCVILTWTEEKGLNSFTFHNLCLTLVSVTLHPLPVEKSDALGCQSRAEARRGEALGRWPLAKARTCGAVINRCTLSMCTWRPWRSGVTRNICSVIHLIWEVGLHPLNHHPKPRPLPVL